MGLLKLLRSLEGGTKFQQIIIGYFVAPISVLLIYPVLRTKSYTSNNYKILKRLVTHTKYKIIINKIGIDRYQYRLLRLSSVSGPVFVSRLLFNLDLALPFTWALRH